MGNPTTLKVVFKNNHQNQGMLLPPDLNDLIAANHPVRVVNDILDKIDITQLVKQYKPGGASSYHPRMLLKVLVYGYINNVYSSRKIEEAVGQTIPYMWLAGMQKPDHNTINRFRGQRLQKTLQPIFTQVVLLLCEEGLLNIKELYTDGTKIEANANRYTFVWGRAMRTSRERIKEQLNELWQYARSVAACEMDDTDPSGFDKIDSEKVNQTISAINEALKDKPASKEVRQKLGYAAKHWSAALDKYEAQEKILGATRNSYSKTDPDATFMRMKDDHMRNGQLKPGYNLQISTNNQFIASYTLHQHPTDTTTLINHLTTHIKSFKQRPGSVTADAGYGSERITNRLEDKGVTGYVTTISSIRINVTESRSKKDRFSKENLVYDPIKDQYCCPIGKPMKNTGVIINKTTERGFTQTLHEYKVASCKGCPLRSECHQQKGSRKIYINQNLIRLTTQADKRLKSKRGLKKRKKRCWDTEPVFGNLKQNHHFKRFMLRGMEKVTIETGLLALAHNLRKKTA